MPLVIRHIETGRYFRKGDWTEFSDFADRFKDKGAVEIAVRKHQIKNAEMVVLQGNSVVGGAPIDITGD